jgi:membrane-associated protein
VSLCLAGYWFGNIPAVKDNLAAVIVVIVALSLAPIALEFLRAYARRAAP